MPAFLAPLLAALGGMLARLFASRLGMWIATAFLFLGLELATYQVLVEPLRDQIAAHLTGLPVQMREWMGVLKIDQYFTVILSAYTAAAVKRTIIRRRAAT